MKHKLIMAFTAAFSIITMNASLAGINDNLDVLLQQTYVDEAQINLLLDPSKYTEKDWDTFVTDTSTNEKLSKLWDKLAKQNYNYNFDNSPKLGRMMMPSAESLLPSPKARVSSKPSLMSEAVLASSMNLGFIDDSLQNMAGDNIGDAQYNTMKAYMIFNMHKFMSCLPWPLNYVCLPSYFKVVKFYNNFMSLGSGRDSFLEKRTRAIFSDYYDVVFDEDYDTSTLHPGFRETLPDAFRHAYATARFSGLFGSSRWGVGLMNAREIDSPNLFTFTQAMDPHNNEVGGEIYKNLPNKSVAAIERKLIANTCYRRIDGVVGNTLPLPSSVKSSMATAKNENTLVYFQPGIMSSGQLTPIEENGTCPIISYDVGILSHDGSCPTIHSGDGASNKVWIEMEDEYSRNRSLQIDYTGSSRTFSDKAFGPYYGYQNAVWGYFDHYPYITRYEFCKVDGRRFFPLTKEYDKQKNYALLKLGTHCPNGSKEFTYHWDNNDKRYHNSNSGDSNNNGTSIWPSSQGKDTNMVFCLFTDSPDGNTMSVFPSFDASTEQFPYAVLAASTFPLAVETGYLYHDDEDKDNGNWMSPTYPDIGDIIRNKHSGRGNNTTVNIARVKIDTDGDGLTDDFEEANGYNPLLTDMDNDGISDFDEINLTKTDPKIADSDGDGMLDGQEIFISNPLKADSDGDGLSDADEIAMGLDPMRTDFDSDGLADNAEILKRTDPTNPDTDGDGANDGEEVSSNRDPLINESAVAFMFSSLL